MQSLRKWPDDIMMVHFKDQSVVFGLTWSAFFCVVGCATNTFSKRLMSVNNSTSSLRDPTFSLRSPYLSILRHNPTC